MAHLSLSFLGRFEVTLDAEPVTAFGADKARALLAYLAIESARPRRRTELSTMFWPESSEKKAAHNLSQSLLRLRQALREKKDSPASSFLIVTTPQDVQFNTYSDSQVDVARFRELLHRANQHHHPEPASCGVCLQWLKQAAELYRGDLLAGFFVSDSLAFEEWRIVQQEKLRGQALETLKWLAAYYEQSGQLDQVEVYARQQIALEAWNEDAQIQLMHAMAQSGRTSAALKQYEGYQHMLDEELGIQPSTKVTLLYEQIRAGGITPSAAAQPAAGEASWLSSQGERRQVTTLVCSRCIQDDSDEIQEQMTFCERHCEGVFSRFWGRRALRQGDACLIYFGYPQAHEDAARRAVHSALAVAAALENHGSVRIGIHTGMLIVGEKRGLRWQDRDLVGKALEIARDCQRLARPGDVAITENTRHLVQDSFELQAFGQSVSSASGQPIQVYKVRRENGAQSRLDWLAQTQRLTAFAGRENELLQLNAGYEKIIQGKGQVVLLSGEPGIGKSRLVWELKKSIPLIGSPAAESVNNNPPVLWLSSRCLPHCQNNSLYPIVELLEQLFGFQPGDSSDLRREKLTGMLTWYQLNSQSNIWLLSLLLGLPTGSQAPETITMAQREQMREIFIALLKKRALEQPLVMIIEDLHWSDPSTVEWLGQSIDIISSIPCLTVLTTRPAFNPDWFSHKDLQPGLFLLTLHPLNSEQSEQMLIDLAGENLFLDERTRRHIVVQADGIPLFIEELTKTVLERSAFEDRTNTKVEIPATLLDSLVARLDHLGAAKETAQWAAILGREFSYPVLQACVPYNEQRLQGDLARLIEAELVAPIEAETQDITTPSQALYAFKHALMQDAAYTSVPKRIRQDQHGRIAKKLETGFPQIVETQPEILAEHYFNADLQTRAVNFWLQAGKRAVAQGATLEARIFFDRVISLLEPGDSERRWQAFWEREEVFDLRGEREAQGADLTSLLALAEVLDDDTRRAQVYLRQSAYAAVLGDYRGTLPPAEAACATARRAHNLTLELNALAYKAQTLTFLGEMIVARSVVEEALAQMPKLEDESVRATVLTVAAQHFLVSGDLARSVQLQCQSLEAAQRAGKHTLELTISANLGLLYAMLGLYAQARTTLEASLARAELLGDRRLHANTLRHLGYVYWWNGESELAQQIQQKALDELRATGDVYGESACLACLGCILEAAGEWALAVEYLAKARMGFSEIGVDADKFEAQAVEARAMLAQGQPAQAQELALEVWNYLCEHGTGELSSPSLIYVCIADVLKATEAAGVSTRDVIEKAHRELLQRAENISDADWRRSFLENVAENREIVDWWSKLSLSLPFNRTTRI